MSAVIKYHLLQKCISKMSALPQVLPLIVSMPPHNNHCIHMYQKTRTRSCRTVAAVSQESACTPMFLHVPSETPALHIKHA